MVVAAAREIRDGEKAFVGMRLPLLGFAVAKELHAPMPLEYSKTVSCAIGRHEPLSLP